MNMNNFAAIATEVWLNTINPQADTLLIEDVWLLQGDFYQGFANALSIGSKWHECTKTELLLLDRIPVLLCSITILYMQYRNLSHLEIKTIIRNSILSTMRCLDLTSNN
ncbi:hypothetical protein CGI77_09635 [Vibrio parahaemolyticus]|uniref:hypothetical protein n=1 Tax=Vibrio parahaemolyticus TaxID=670 RepID=UPI0011234118|nr:hypothetical protein [Vibrio parahaemolyticus]TOH58852.1 hypothetical protein CGI77_09635 [Vibrio parahaemolyticus]